MSQEHFVSLGAKGRGRGGRGGARTCGQLSAYTTHVIRTYGGGGVARSAAHTTAAVIKGAASPTRILPL